MNRWTRTWTIKHRQIIEPTHELLTPYTNYWHHRRTTQPIDRRTVETTDEPLNTQTDHWVHRQTIELKDKQLGRQKNIETTDEPLHPLMNRWTHRRIIEPRNEPLNPQTNHEFYKRTSVGNITVQASLCGVWDGILMSPQMLWSKSKFFVASSTCVGLPARQRLGAGTKNGKEKIGWESRMKRRPRKRAD